MPQYQFGPYQFTFSGANSGYGPTKIDGPDRTAYVIEHQIPAKEGGVVEYLGSQQSLYQWKGFIAPPQDGPYDGTAAFYLSGSYWVGLNTDDAKDTLVSLRGSGAQVLKIESTYSNESGYQRWYSNGFFVLEKATMAFEAGHTYPYYPYGIAFHGASPGTYGNSSGTTTFGNVAGHYLSGYIWAWHLVSGLPLGEPINTLGVYIQSVASGNITLGVYDVNVALQAQSASQAVHSGWNYFPIQPGFTSKSGATYWLAIMGDATGHSGYSIATNNTSGGTTFSVQSGIVYASGFPQTFAPGTFAAISGFNLNLVMVTA